MTSASGDISLPGEEQGAGRNEGEVGMRGPSRAKSISKPLLAGLIVALISAGVWLAPQFAVADPPPPEPPGIEIPEVFCFRITDLADVLGDPEGDRFKLEFEILNWTATEAHRLYLSLSTGTGRNGSRQAKPFIVGSKIDPNGRPFLDGDDDANFPPLDGEPGAKTGQINDWAVSLQTGTSVVYAETTGTAGNGLAARDLLGAATTADACGLVPGCALVSGSPVLSSVESVDNGGPGVDGLVDNVLDGFTLNVDDFDGGEILSLDWFLADESGSPIGVSGEGNAFGFGTYSIYRVDPGIVFADGFECGDVLAWILPPSPGIANGPALWQRIPDAPEGPGVNTGTTSSLRDMFVSTTPGGVTFEVELGSALTPPFQNPADNTLGAPISAEFKIPKGLTTFIVE